MNKIPALGKLIRSKRDQLGLTLREVGDRAGTTDTTVMRIESGYIAKPSAEVLSSLAAALSIPLSDVYAAAGYVVPSELPSFQPYLRAKYAELPASAIHQLEKTFNDIARRYGTDGPKPGEDEQ